MNTITAAAELLESVIFTSHGRDPFYEMNGAQLITADDQLNTKLLDMSPDVYSLISDAIDNAETMSAAHYVVIITTGWAAPLNTDGTAPSAPSAHADRRRVLLTNILDTDTGQVVSVLRFADQPQETIVDTGNATGALADALADLFNSINAER